jgi:trk system potassium uptake protein TrkA
LFGIPKKIARIREQAYLQPAWSNLFSRAHMPIDVIISPEVVIANDIFQRLAVPGTTYVATLADGAAHLVGVICGKDCPVINTPLNQLSSLFPNLVFKVVAVLRNNKPIIPGGNEQLAAGDEAFFVVDTRHLKRVMAAFGHEEKEARRIVIAGGGNIGFGLAKLLLQKGRGIQIKMIEKSPERARFLSENLENIIVLQGSSLDKDILEDAAIDSAETFVAVTNDDESNILGSLLAKQHGCKNVVTLVNNTVYSSLVGPLGVDAIVSPRATIVATIMQHVRRGRIKGLYNLREGFAELIEAEISESTSIANKEIADLELPQDVLIAAIVRDNAVLLPDDQLTIRAGDHVIILTSQAQTKNVEKMFSVQVDLF